jgi:hypothetical protein
VDVVLELSKVHEEEAGRGEVWRSWPSSPLWLGILPLFPAPAFGCIGT